MPEDHQGGDQHRRASAQPHQAVDHLEKLVIACAMLLWGMPCKNGILDGCSMVVLKCSENQPEDPHSAVSAGQCLPPAWEVMTHELDLNSAKRGRKIF